MDKGNDRHPSDWLPPGASAPRKGGGVTGQSKAMEWVVGGVAGLLIIGAAIGLKSCMSSSGPVRAELGAPSGTTNTHGAWAYMQQFVLKRLKSPASAEFPFGGARDVQPLGDNRYAVKSYVDSQNAFGATVRTHFYGVIKQTSAGWELESLIVEE